MINLINVFRFVFICLLLFAVFLICEKPILLSIDWNYQQCNLVQYPLQSILLYKQRLCRRVKWGCTEGGIVGTSLSHSSKDFIAAHIICLNFLQQQLSPTPASINGEINNPVSNILDRLKPPSAQIWVNKDSPCIMVISSDFWDTGNNGKISNFITTRNLI